MKNLLLIGCGGHARSLIDLIESTSKWSISGLVGLPHEVGSMIYSYPIIGSDSDLGTLRKQNDSALLAIGQLPNSEPRRRLAEHLCQFSYNFPVLVSPHAVVSRHAQLSPGTTVGHGAVVNAGAIIGKHCIINSMSLVEHDSVIGDYCHISTGALINGGVSIGSFSFIGSGAVLREGIELPPGSVVGAGKRVMAWPMRD